MVQRGQTLSWEVTGSRIGGILPARGETRDLREKQRAACETQGQTKAPEQRRPGLRNGAKLGGSCWPEGRGRSQPRVSRSQKPNLVCVGGWSLGTKYTLHNTHQRKEAGRRHQTPPLETAGCGGHTPQVGSGQGHCSPDFPGISILTHSLAWGLAGNVGLGLPRLCDHGRLAHPL